MPTDKTRRTVYSIYARHNGKPAGFCGQYRTKAEAQEARPSGAVVKRETITAEQWDRWKASGFRARTGWALPMRPRYPINGVRIRLP